MGFHEMTKFDHLLISNADRLKQLVENAYGTKLVPISAEVSEGALGKVFEIENGLPERELLPQHEWTTSEGESKLPVAVKIMRDNLKADMQKRFYEEMPHLERLSAVEKQEGTHYCIRPYKPSKVTSPDIIFMEKAEGSRLDQLTALNEAMKLKVAHQIFDSLRISHKADVSWKDKGADDFILSMYEGPAGRPNLRVIDWNVQHDLMPLSSTQKAHEIAAFLKTKEYFTDRRLLFSAILDSFGFESEGLKLFSRDYEQKHPNEVQLPWITWDQQHELIDPKGTIEEIEKGVLVIGSRLKEKIVREGRQKALNIVLGMYSCNLEDSSTANTKKVLCLPDALKKMIIGLYERKSTLYENPYGSLDNDDPLVAEMARAQPSSRGEEYKPDYGRLDSLDRRLYGVLVQIQGK